jgi:hypothetical protein
VLCRVAEVEMSARHPVLQHPCPPERARHATLEVATLIVGLPGTFLTTALVLYALMVGGEYAWFWAAGVGGSFLSLMAVLWVARAARG